MRFINTLNSAAVLGIAAALSCSGCANQAKEEFSPKLGVCTTPDNGALLEKNGYDFIQPGVRNFLVPDEPDSVFARLLDQQRSLGIAVMACNNFIPKTMKAVGPDAVPDEIIAYAEKVFLRAKEAGVGIIVFGSGGSRKVPDGFSAGEARHQFVSLCRRMAPLAARYGIVICLENLNKGETNFINSVKEAASIAREVNHPSFKILPDFYHMLREGEPASHIVEAKEFVYHCDIAEKDNRTPPGVVGDDFRPYLAALREIGFNGGIAIEGRWENLEGQLAAALGETKRQIDQVNKR